MQGFQETQNQIRMNSDFNSTTRCFNSWSDLGFQGNLCRVLVTLVSSSNAFPSLISAGKSRWLQVLTWRAFPQCVSGCGCWVLWHQRRRAHSSHTWKACRWSAWQRGSLALRAGRRTGSSDHIGRACNGREKQHAISAFCWHEQEITHKGAPDLPVISKENCGCTSLAVSWGNTYPKLHSLFNKCKILGQELNEGPQTIIQQTSEAALHIIRLLNSLKLNTVLFDKKKKYPRTLEPRDSWHPLSVGASYSLTYKCMSDGYVYILAVFCSCSQLNSSSCFGGNFRDHLFQLETWKKWPIYYNYLSVFLFQLKIFTFY